MSCETQQKPCWLILIEWSQLNELHLSWGSNPASPSLVFLGGLLRSEEVPAEWWGSWVCQRAMESLWGWFVTKMLRSPFFFFLAILGGGGDSTAIRFENQLTLVN